MAENEELFRKKQSKKTVGFVIIGIVIIALSLLTPEDLQDISHLQAYQSRMRTLFNLTG